jgi:hypothetical protein
MPKGWTIETLKEHFDELRKDDQLAVASALNAAEKAAAKADTAMEKRFDGLNEFRATLADQANTLLPRHEWSAGHAALVDRVNTIADQLTKLESKSEGKREGVGGTGATVFQVIIGLAAVVAMIATTSTFFAGPRALPVSNPVVAMPQSGAPSLTVQHQ